jgi:hypothetical protein
MQNIEDVNYCRSGIVKFVSGKCNGFIVRKNLLLHYDANSTSESFGRAFFIHPV